MSSPPFPVSVSPIAPPVSVFALPSPVSVSGSARLELVNSALVTSSQVFAFKPMPKSTAPSPLVSPSTIVSPVLLL